MRDELSASASASTPASALPAAYPSVAAACIIILAARPSPTMASRLKSAIAQLGTPARGVNGGQL